MGPDPGRKKPLQVLARLAWIEAPRRATTPSEDPGSLCGPLRPLRLCVEMQCFGYSAARAPPNSAERNRLRRYAPSRGGSAMAAGSATTLIAANTDPGVL